MGGVILNETFEVLNQIALDALSNNEYILAQTLFRKNAKKNPCFASFNNLGAFYVFEGLQISENRTRGATKLGEYYLKKAETQQEHHLICLALGWIRFRDEDYKEASKHFRQACDLKQDHASAYNLAITLYRMSMYDEALIWLEIALNSCDVSVYAETYVAYLFSLLHIDKRKCRQELDQLLDDNTSYTERDKFLLAFLCGDLRTAESRIEPMLKNWSIDVVEMAMVFDCLFTFGKGGEAQGYLRQRIEILEDSDYNTKPEINSLQKAFSQEEYRKELISNFRHVMPLIQQCCYYGCKEHNP